MNSPSTSGFDQQPLPVTRLNPVKVWMDHANDLGAKADGLREELLRAKEEIAALKLSAKLREEDVALGQARHHGTDSEKVQRLFLRFAIFVFLALLAWEWRRPLLSLVCN